MITLIEAKNFRCLKYIHQPLDRFHVLVGANASGKTTFMDTINFLSDIVSSGIDYAITRRTRNYEDLTYAEQGGNIELALEAAIPKEITDKFEGLDAEYNIIRYEIQVGLHPVTGEHAIIAENVRLVKADFISKENQARINFPEFFFREESLLTKYKSGKSSILVIRKMLNGNDNFYSEINRSTKGKGWFPSFKLGHRKSALGNMPADESKLPASNWLRSFLVEGVQLFILDSLNIRQASPPGQVKTFKTDGSNLPWVIDDLKKNNNKLFSDWLAHVQTALPDIQDIYIVERPDDRHKYLKIIYNNGIEVPSWFASDGTLRLLALTLSAYLPNFAGVYLIEEPENGIHPKAIETVYQSLSSVYAAQILLATHSPVILGIVEPIEVLCFAKTDQGITDIVRGSNHPLLRDWQGETNLSTFYVAGVLG